MQPPRTCQVDSTGKLVGWAGWWHGPPCACWQLTCCLCMTWARAAYLTLPLVPLHLGTQPKGVLGEQGGVAAWVKQPHILEYHSMLTPALHWGMIDVWARGFRAGLCGQAGSVIKDDGPLAERRGVTGGLNPKQPQCYRAPQLCTAGVGLRGQQYGTYTRACA